MDDNNNNNGGDYDNGDDDETSRNETNGEDVDDPHDSVVAAVDGGGGGIAEAAAAAAGDDDDMDMNENNTRDNDDDDHDDVVDDNNIDDDREPERMMDVEEEQDRQQAVAEQDQEEETMVEGGGGGTGDSEPVVAGDSIGDIAAAAAGDDDNHDDDDGINDNDNDQVEPPSTPQAASTTPRRGDSQDQGDDEDDEERVGQERNNENNDGDDMMAIPSTPGNRNNNNSSSNAGSNGNDSDDDSDDDDHRPNMGATILGATPLSDLDGLDTSGSGGRGRRRNPAAANNNHNNDDDDTTTTGDDNDSVAANLRFDDYDNVHRDMDDEDDDDDDDLLDGNDATNLNAPRGTDIDVHVAATTFQSFLRDYPNNVRGSRGGGAGSSRRRRQRRRQGEDGDSSDSSDDDSMSDADDDEIVTPIYQAKLQDMLHQTTQGSLDIDTEHLYRYNKKLYQQMVSFPMDIIPLMDIVVQREMKRLRDMEVAAIRRNNNDDDDDLSQYPLPIVQVRPYRLHSQQVANLRQLDPEAIDTLIAIRGMIVRSSPIIPDLKVAHFTCCICGNDQQVRIDRGRIAEPRQCPSCNTKDSYDLIHNRCIFADKQLVRLQETPDQVPAGQTPASVITFCFDDLVDACQPGDKVEVTGVLRAQPVRIHPRVTKVKSVYKTYVDVIHFRTINGMESKSSNSKNANGSKTSTAKLAQDRIDELKRLSQQPDIYEQLTRSLAPSIWELDNVKKGVLCMLFGGNTKRVRNRRSTNNDGDDDWSDEDDDDQDDDGDVEDTKLNKRGDINILLCGDPGTSKSQLLSYVHKLSSRGIYTSGKGSSAVGLTASVVRDPETKDLVLESGALVLSDRGICCIDEFDKMSDATRSILHEAMEQQTVSIAKAGIISSLNARTSILASANPVESRYNPNLSVVENIRLPPTLLSRFDLIYLILDSPNVESDRQLAKHLVGLYYETPNVVRPPMSTDLLRDYIDYARENIFPRLSDEATDELLKSYLELRNPPGGNVGNNGSRTISATPRQLESLIRTSEALAKMRYSSEVTRADAKEAVRLLKVATQAAATDPRTGRIDMDMINTGRTSNEREMEESLYIGLREYLSERRGNRLSVRDVTRQLGEISGTTVPQDEVVTALKRLDADGAVQFNERNQTVFARTGVA